MLDPPWKRPPAPDGKYLVITRSDSETFSNTSPFLIKKTIDSAVGGEVAECKKTRDGNLLIKTKNNLQAEKLINLPQCLATSQFKCQNTDHLIPAKELYTATT